MDQYTLKLIYEPIYFIIILIGFNLVFKVYKRPLLTQIMYYSILGIFFLISLMFIKLDKHKLEKEKIHYSNISKILTVIIVITTVSFLYYMLN